MRTAMLLLALLVSSAAPTGARGSTPTPAAKVFLTIEEALELAFPGCEVTRSTLYLTQAQERRVAALAQVPYEGRVARPYVATRGGEVVGTAYFDAHRVRTLRQTLMVVVDPEQRIGRVEVLAFGEPEDFIPRGNWYGQFVGRALDEELRLGRAIRVVTGATLTARATTDCARRALALHRALAEIAAGDGVEGGAPAGAAAE
jgi:Na+-translocating ferredoxin:NAD+ oxidoreductase subunit G